MALGTSAVELSQTHYVALGIWGTVELEIHTRHQGTLASGAVELYQTHWRAPDSGELWSYLKHTGRHWAPVGCGAISSTLNGTWFRSTSNTIVPALSLVEFMLPG